MVEVGGWLAAGVPRKQGLLTDQGCLGASSPSSWLLFLQANCKVIGHVRNACSAAYDGDLRHAWWQEEICWMLGSSGTGVAH